VFDRRLIANFDWTLFFAALLLSVLGIVNLYSAGSFSSGQSATPFFIKQTYWLFIGLFLFFVVIAIDYQFIARQAYFIHLTAMMLLVFVLLWGTSSTGALRWLQIGPFSFQPSEFAKISLVIFLSYALSGTTPSAPSQFQGLITPTLFTLITFLLIFLEPDLGTASLFLLIFISFLFLVRLDRRSIVVFITTGIILLPCSWLFLEDYQKNRVFAFLSPGKDSLRAGYQAVQSKIAIGSGMVFGKGFLNGTQSQLRFLPEQHTDFVFSVWAEEWGFAGVLLVLLLFFVVISKSLKIAALSKDRLGSFIAIGIVLIFFWQIGINVGMVSGMLPIVGITLPLVSYGGSSLISTWIGIGLLLNIKMRRLVF
jgi:rod shape determining protein RodA